MSPEPVGSTHLRFGDARVVEIYVCGNPKVVRSPGCDHGRNEESRNGRDKKIDILEAYIWTSESFRVKSAFYWSTGRLPEPPGGLLGLHGPRGRRGKEAGGGRAPLPFLVRIGQGKGGGAPLSFPSSSSFPPSPPGAPPPGRPHLPPCSFIYGGRGHPRDTTIDLIF